MEEEPDLPDYLEDVREAFWMLIQGCGMNGGGFTALHLEPIRAVDAIMVAETFGFDPLYFLRVIQPAATLYRTETTARLAAKT